MIIADTSGLIATKFYLNPHMGGVKAALGFVSDQIRFLVFMASAVHHSVKMRKAVFPHFLECVDAIFFILAGKKNILKSLSV